MQTKLDENLYSRQLYVLGTDTMKSFQSSSVLIVGMSGLGQEIAKNIILAGIHKVHLHDPKLVTIKDLSTGFYFTQSCINKRRDHCVLSKMQELNPYVNVSVVDDLETMIYTTVIVTNQSYKQLLNHKLHGMFICCQVNGLFSQVFIDFKTFVIKDENGEPLLQGTINDVTNDVMTVIDEERHQLENNRIRMYRHNSDEVYTCNVKAIDNKRVELIGYTGFDFFGGTYEEIKVPKQMEYLTLNDSIMKPKIMNEDDKAKIIHNCYYLYEEGKDLDSIYKENLENLPFKIYDQEIVKAFEYMHDIEIMPMVSVVGGFVAQEALKSCSGKFTPLNQYYYFDSLECLNYNVKEKEEIRDENNNIVEVKYDYLARYLKQPFEAKETRYYSYEKLFKQNFELLRNSKVFIIGAGAIGCEHLKNIVMSGVGVDGKLYLTDMDSIEQSNLNRQFLFKQKDVNKMKSEIAVREAKNMNEDYQIKKQKNNEETITHYTTKVGSETENVFSDSFYGNLTLIANALDNIEARLYVDSRCVINSVPLFESGTLGTKGNTQVILPHKTESYASSTDPPEKSIPMCTLRNFPHLIEHTIEFALSEFQSYFTDKIVNVKDFFAKQKSDSIKVDTMDDVIDFVKDVPENEKDLLRNSFDLFCDNFYVKICKLLIAFPIDSLTKEGIPFWSPPKRAPGPVWFDTKNYVHLMFIKSCALLYAKIFNMKCEIDEDMIIEYFNAHKDEMFDKAKEKLLNTSKTEIMNDGDIRMTVDRKRFTSLEPIEFEKDDDTNHHIDFIFACANIRAQNYKIKEATKLQVKGIAGKIIPAIATTTAMVSGLSVLEMYKYIFDCKFEAFKNTYLTLALPMIASSEPFEPIKKKVEKYDLGLKEYTLWDKIEFEDMKVKDFIEMFKTKYGLEITMISANGKSVFCSFFQQNLYEKNLDKKFGELEHIKEWVTYVCLDCLFSDEDIEVPNLVIKLK